MEWIEIDGKQVPLLEPPDSYKEMPRRGLQVAFKYKRVIRNVFLMVSVPLLLIVLLAPQKYRGTARVFIKSNRVLGPDSSLNNAATEALLNTEIQLIRSREVLRQLSKELPFPVQGWLDVGSPTKIEATPVKATSIIQIGLISTNPEWAAKVVNRAAELHQAQSLNVRKTQGIEKFYDEQDRRLRGDLLRAEQDLKKFQEREGVIDAPKEVDASLSALAFAEKSVKDTDAAIRETEKRITVLDQQLKAQQPTVLSSKSVSVDPVYAAIRARLTQLELERQGLLQRYLPKDRLIVDKEREIAELKKQLEEAEKTTVGSENITLNTVHHERTPGGQGPTSSFEREARF